jgi:hypothetical protein
MALSAENAKKKRRRLTRAEYESLDEALYEIVQEQKPMSVRGLYYQAEVKGLVGKEDRDYNLIQRRCLLLRYNEVMPYYWITDNSRWVNKIDRYDGQEEFRKKIASLYRRDYWRHEPVRVEIWIEKDALAGVIMDTVVDEWGVDLYVQKGFSSASYLYNAAEEIKRIGKPTHIYVLSDFDPSGKCSHANIVPGLGRHLNGKIDFEVTVHELAVTLDQIQEWDLPTRPTKVKKNPHWAKFLEEYGDDAYQSCELDAIRPDYLRDLVSNAIESHWSNKHTLEQLQVIEKAEQEALASMRLTS